jgi:hypothetical protein
MMKNENQVSMVKLSFSSLCIKIKLKNTILAEIFLGSIKANFAIYKYIFILRKIGGRGRLIE